MSIFYMMTSIIFVFGGFIWSFVHDHSGFGYFLTYLVSGSAGMLVGAIILCVRAPERAEDKIEALPAAE